MTSWLLGLALLAPAGPPTLDEADVEDEVRRMARELLDPEESDSE